MHPPHPHTQNWHPSRRTLLGLGLSLWAGPALAASPPAKKGGHFRVGVGAGQKTDSLNPATWNNGFTFLLGRSLFSATLTQIAATGRPVPHLAESLEPSKDALTWRVKLVSGATFHDGRSLTSADVLATFMFHQNPANASAAAPLLANVAAIKTDGDGAVVFILHNGDAEFPYLLADSHLPIFPAKDGAMDFASGIGAGPYKLTRFEPGKSLEAVRHENYFGTCWFDSVELLCLPETTARLSALSTGRVDYINRLDPATAQQLGKQGVALYNTPSLAHVTAPMLVDAKPFDQPELRQALKLALNRQALLDRMLKGYGVIGNDSPLYRADAAPAAYDPDQAKALLKKLGLAETGLELSVSDAAFAGCVETGYTIADQLADLGLAVSVTRERDADYWTRVWKRKPWCLHRNPGMAAPVALLAQSFGPNNDTHWANKDFSALIARARLELDDGKRDGLIAEASKIVSADGGLPVLWFSNHLGALAPHLGHGPLNTDSDADGGYCFERWWMA